ncbi:MAG: cytochrome c oxidase subunit 3 [Thermoflexibacteraceae bacterium]|jgi:cytochrome c oxidase subunit 3
MKNTELLQEQPSPTLAMNPKKFALWLFIVTVVMLFGAFTSAYIVRAAEGNWLEFDMPKIFLYSTLIILASSGTMHWAYLSAKKDELATAKIAMSITTVLGISFLVMQFLGWGALVEAGVYFAGTQSNPAGSFVYVLSMLHGVHLVGGVVYLLYVVLALFQYKIHAKAMLAMEMCATYWHFLGVLWVYLYFFLQLNN